MRHLMTLLAIPVALLTCGVAFAADAPVGITLNGETCTATPVKNVSPEFGLPLPQTISCAQTPSGTLSYGRVPGLVPATADATTRAVIARRFQESPLFANLRRGMICKDGIWLDGAASGNTALLALPCTLREGEWHHLVLVSPEAGRFAVADGGATTLPALLAMLKSPRSGDTRAAQTALIERIWGKVIPLVAASDIARLAQAIRAGRTANGLGNYADAEASFREALELETGPLKANDDVVATTLLDLALNVSNQGRSDEAAALFRRATPMMQASARAITKARLATYLALDAANAGNTQQGLPLARDAAASWRTLVSDQQSQAPLDTTAPVSVTQEQGELANALNLLALMELRSDNLVQAYSAASEALLILNKSDSLPRWWKADTLVVLGEISVAQGRLSAAETYLSAALKLRRQLFGDSAPTIRVLTALARAYQHEGMTTSTIVTYREIFKLARALPSTRGIFTAEMLVPFATAIVATAETLTDPVAKRGLYAEAFDAFQLVQSPLVDKTVAQAAARLSTQDPAIARLIGDMQDKQREIDFARLKLAHEQSLADNERSSQAEADLKSQIDAATAAVTATRKTLASKYPAYDTLMSPAVVNLDQLRATLKPKEGVLSFLVGREKSFAQLVTREGAAVAEVSAGDAALRETVTALRRPLEIQGGTISEFNLVEANQFHDLLLGGLKSSLADIDHLVVVPAGPLSNLPFGLLVASAPGNRGYDKADWLVRSKTLAYTPSLQALSALRNTKPRIAPRQALLAFGDPALTGHIGKKGESSPMALLANNCRLGGPMPAGLLRALTPLPDTARELGVVASTLGVSPQNLFLGANATEANFRKQTLEDYRVLYFATHGLLPGELRCQAEPGLVLTPPAISSTTLLDGLLESSEIASMRLNADLVVLSACNTAAGDNRFGGGDALSGLAEAFFHAGARNMLVTHWQVPSAATSDLMSGLFTTLRASPGDSVGDALRQAQLGLIGKRQTAHPFFWAAFVVLGDGAGLPVKTPIQASIR